MIRTANMIHAAPSNFKDLWGTPDHIFNPLNRIFQFNLDPCCTKETAKCEKFYTPEQDGLISDWSKMRVFCNPPYSRGNIDKWVKMCHEMSGLSECIVALLPVSTSADWFQDYILGNTLYWINKRVQFVGAKTKAPFSSVIVHFNREDRNLKWQQVEKNIY